MSVHAGVIAVAVLCQGGLVPPCSKYESNVSATNSLDSGSLDLNGYFCPPGAGQLYDASKKRPYVGSKLVRLSDGEYAAEKPEFYSEADAVYAVDVQRPPCDCRGRAIRWSAEHLPATSPRATEFLSATRGRYPWEPSGDGTPCDYVELGVSRGSVAGSAWSGGGCGCARGVC